MVVQHYILHNKLHFIKTNLILELRLVKYIFQLKYVFKIAKTNKKII